jgi:S1-C subfamily serine protease
VGINSAKIGGTAEGIGFAVAASTAQPVFDELVRNKRVSWPYLGISVATVSPASKLEFSLSVDRGAVIVEVVRGTPVYRAGMQPGDVIIKFDDTEITSASELILALRKRRAGETATITYVRGREEHTVSLVLAERPDRF